MSNFHNPEYELLLEQLAKLGHRPQALYDERFNITKEQLEKAQSILAETRRLALAFSDERDASIEDARMKDLADKTNHNIEREQVKESKDLILKRKAKATAKRRVIAEDAIARANIRHTAWYNQLLNSKLRPYMAGYCEAPGPEPQQPNERWFCKEWKLKAQFKKYRLELGL